MEFVFVREDSVSRQEKVKAFWKFLDDQNCLQPHKGTRGKMYSNWVIIYIRQECVFIVHHFTVISCITC